MHTSATNMNGRNMSRPIKANLIKADFFSSAINGVFPKNRLFTYKSCCSALIMPFTAANAGTAKISVSTSINAMALMLPRPLPMPSNTIRPTYSPIISNNGQNSKAQ
ncbi:Uncharacterised protein [Acinetobacter baumannii]|nr:Uncharacterised protein [Acinetobacter baumannii]